MARQAEADRQGVLRCRETVIAMSHQNVAARTKVKQPRTIAYLCYQTRFFTSHFLPAVRAAQANGFKVFALLPTLPLADQMPADVEVFLIRAARSKSPELRLLPETLSVSSALQRCRPDIVQAVALRACVVLFLASGLVPVPYKIFTVTGLGLIDIDPHWSMQVKRRFVYWLLRMAERRSSTAFVFENNADATRIGIDCGRRSKCLNLMGSGVNPSVFVEHPYPSLPPLKLAMVSRMIWSKGIDLAVEAVAELVAKGMSVELDLYGAPDVHNRRHFSTAVLEDWSRRAGIKWRGPVRDVPAVWRDHHVGLFPSRGGEGLPKSMLEAAACGRALITTNVSGCADFVRPDVEGLVVQRDSIAEIGQAIETMLGDAEMLTRMGRAARARVLANATEDIISSRYRAFLNAFDGPPR
jgi:glycosyltransferase involved in cell wall biosynthesis